MPLSNDVCIHTHTSGRDSISGGVNGVRGSVGNVGGMRGAVDKPIKVNNR